MTSNCFFVSARGITVQSCHLSFEVHRPLLMLSISECFILSSRLGGAGKPWTFLPIAFTI